MGRPAIRVWGPYKDGPAKYRLKLSEGDVARSLCFKTATEAEAVKTKLQEDATLAIAHKLTVGEVLDAYRQDVVATRAVKAETAEHVHAQLVRFLPLESPITRLTAERAERLYRELAETPSPRTRRPLAATTHHFVLSLAKGFFRWAVKRGHCTKNPFSDVTPLGKKSAGKPQLRIDEARRFETAARALAESGDGGALGVLLMLHLGLRQGEVGARVVRDVDDDGRVLWIPSGKTRNARRRLRVPEALRGLLLKQTQGKPADALLFYSGTRPPHRRYFWQKVHAVCQRAAVPEVCPHSLRGLHATLALEAGATSELVARALGHGSFEVTARHYATPDSVDNARSARVSETLGAPAVATSADQIVAALINLSAAELSAILARVSAAKAERG